MLCYNIQHNLSWRVSGLITPCNWLDTFPASRTIEEMYSREEYLQLKSDNNQNIKNPFCQKCWDKESVGKTSKRQNDNQMSMIYLKKNPDFLKVDVAIGDKCNAACVTCGPQASTIWQKELYGRTIKINTQQLFWDEIFKNRHNIVQLDFGGGEPWINDIDKQLHLFQILIDEKLSHKIKLRYNTNGSLYPKQIIDLFDKFREVEITLSIDDSEQRFEYNRYPLKWAKVTENISKLNKLKNNNPKIKLTINYTVSVFTFWYIDQFEIYSNKVLDLPNISWSVLHHPLVYNIKSIPLSFKKNIPDTNIFYNFISENPMDNWKQQFFNVVNNLDERRGTDFHKTFPEISNIFN